jgi:anti-sigma B factor antagonist
MSLDIIQREREGIILLDLKGRIIAGPEIEVFWSAIERVSEKENPNVILNLQEIDAIDSSGLGAMVMGQMHLRKVGGTVKLALLDRREFQTVLLTTISSMFEVFEDETDAVNSFFPGREIRRFDILEFVSQSKEGQAIEPRKDE